MREIVILSGKGGTGKTSIAASLAVLADNKVMADCDVDAADLHLLLNPAVEEEHEFYGGKVAAIDEDKCTRCGLCQQLCRFGAISDFRIVPVSCEGCAFCANACPSQAISMQDSLCGKWFLSATRYGTLVHARLGIAQENSGKLVSTVRKRAQEVAVEQGADYIICDGPPGIGCPVISSLSGADLALLVTEPTLSGLHDLERVITLCRHFGVPVIVCINKYDINLDNTASIERYCQKEKIAVIGKIPADDVFTGALVRKVPVVEYNTGNVARRLTALWERITAEAGG
jgi:MinD superfamily P-loop ATPase